MSALIAIGHIVGALIVLVAFGVGVLMLAGWENERNQKGALEEMSLALGIPVGELDNAEHQAKVVQFAAARFSSELFRNRLSDLCGWVHTGWGWLGTLLQVGVLLGAIWYTLTDDLSNSVHAWWIIPIALFFWISSVSFALICKLLTGRFPGQARQARKMLAKFVGERQIDQLENDLLATAVREWEAAREARQRAWEAAIAPEVAAFDLAVKRIKEDAAGPILGFLATRESNEAELDAAKRALEEAKLRATPVYDAAKQTAIKNFRDATRLLPRVKIGGHGAGYDDHRVEPSRLPD